MERRTIAEGSLPFDLKTGPLLRTRLLRLAEHDHMLLLTVHHIVSDGWSIGVFSDELGAHYQDFTQTTDAEVIDLLSRARAGSLAAG